MKKFEVVLDHAQYAKFIRATTNVEGMKWFPVKEDPAYKDGVFTFLFSDDEYTEIMEVLTSTGLYKIGDPESNKTAAFVEIFEHFLSDQGKSSRSQRFLKLVEAGDSVTEFEFTIDVDPSGGMDALWGSPDGFRENWVVEGKIDGGLCHMDCHNEDGEAVTVVYVAHNVEVDHGGVSSEVFQLILAELLGDFLRDSRSGLRAIFVGKPKDETSS